MRVLAAWLIRAQFRSRRAATLLSMLAIALDVALGYSIHLINDVALGDFSRAMKTVQGEPDAVIAARDSVGSVPLPLVDEIARDPAVLIAAPVIETRVRIGNLRTPVRLIGIDVFTAAAMMPGLLPRDAERPATGGILDGALYLSPALLAELGPQASATLTLLRGDQRWSATIGGDLPAAGPDDLLLVADIASVQEHFEPVGAVSEIRVRLAPDSDPAGWRAGVAARLPPALLLRVAQDDSERASNLSRAYRVNLNVLALVALLTGVFLVVATQLTGVAQLSTQFALLGVLGLPPRMRLLQVLLEGLTIGLPGALLGLVLGYALALAFTHLLGGDLGGGYFSGKVPLIVPQLLPAAGFLLLGCAASLTGAAYPAYLKLRQPLVEALNNGFTARPQAVRQRRRQLLLPASLALAGGRAAAVATAVGVAAGRLRRDRPRSAHRHRQRAAADAGDLRPGGRIAVSEAMQEIYRIGPGQSLRLPLLGGDVEVFVGGVWRDYARQFGALVISRDDYQRLGGDFRPSDLALWPRPGEEAAAGEWLAAHAAAYALEVAESAGIRRLSLTIFDKSFAVTYALEAAMVIGVFGLAVTLTASVWLRARELATPAALGFDQRMLRHALMLEVR